jgi:hypothetical protein
MEIQQNKDVSRKLQLSQETIINLTQQRQFSYDDDSGCGHTKHGYDCLSYKGYTCTSCYEYDRGCGK